MRTLAIRCPAQSFIVRPHPFENVDRYRSEFSEQANITVDGSGSVLNVIHNSVGVIHLNCGTSIEAVLLGKTPLSMEFLNTPHMASHSSLPSRVSQPVASLDELTHEVSRLGEGASEFDFSDRHARIIEPWFYLNDGCAADRIANVLLASLQKQEKIANRPSIRTSLRSSRRRSCWGQRLQALLANIFGSYFSSRLRTLFQPVRREKRLDPGIVASKLAALAKHDGVSAPHVAAALHPLTRLRLSSVQITPA